MDQRPTTTNGVVVAADSDEPIRCPVPLPLEDQDFAALELNVQLPRNVAEVWLASWASDQRAAGELRHSGTWVRWALKSIRGEWSDTGKKATMRAAAAPPAESGPTPEPEVKTYADVRAARAKGAA